MLTGLSTTTFRWTIIRYSSRSATSSADLSVCSMASVVGLVSAGPEGPGLLGVVFGVEPRLRAALEDRLEAMVLKRLSSAERCPCSTWVGLGLRVGVVGVEVGLGFGFGFGFGLGLG